MRLRSASVLLGVLLAVAGALPGIAGAKGPGGTRSWKVAIRGPVQFDLSLAQIGFGAPAHAAAGSHGGRRTSTIRLAIRGTTGLDYVASALLRSSPLGRPRALVLVVNRRPRGSLAADLAEIPLTVTAPRRLGDPLVIESSDPLTRPRALAPALCDLPIRGASLEPGGLRPELSRGPSLGGWNAQEAIAQAYDLVCHRPYLQAFRQAVSQSSGAGCESGQGAPLLCCPPNAMCVPPRCPPCPCDPAACPAAVGTREDLLVCPLQTIGEACPL
jgi:hypothetical protein